METVMRYLVVGAVLIGLIAFASWCKATEPYSAWQAAKEQAYEMAEAGQVTVEKTVLNPRSGMHNEPNRPILHLDGVKFIFTPSPRHPDFVRAWELNPGDKTVLVYSERCLVPDEEDGRSSYLRLGRIDKAH